MELADLGTTDPEEAIGMPSAHILRFLFPASYRLDIIYYSYTEWQILRSLLVPMPIHSTFYNFHIYLVYIACTGKIFRR